MYIQDLENKGVLKMEYTEDMYLEDKKIACWVFSKKFLFLNRLKEDLIQLALVNLYCSRPNYDSSKGTYFTFAIKVCYQSMLKILYKEKKSTNNFNNSSLSFVVKDNATLEDFIGKNDNVDSNMNCEYILKTCKDILNNNKSKTFKTINTLYLKGYNTSQIAKILNVTRQCTNIYVKKFRKLLKARLIRENYL